MGSWPINLLFVFSYSFKNIFETMETVSMKKRFVITNVVSILCMLIAVHAQGDFPPDYSSSQSEFPQNSQDMKYPRETQKSSLEEQSHSPNTSLSSESIFPQDPNEPFEDPFESEFPNETDSNVKIQSPPPSPAPLSSATPPSPTKPPYPPKHPWILDNTCKTRCSTLCIRHKVPLLNNLCKEICGKRCILYYWQLVYNCTIHCAYSMPKICKSDKKKEAGYVSYCYHKCIKKF
ncbi:hypothetical protein V6Z11_A07G048000 [Gossypium hirsutum]|nr:hypothetical protein ES288_A07G048700v1 [Gossypium darwinii]